MLRKKNIRVSPYNSERLKREIYSHYKNPILREGQFVFNTAYQLYPTAAQAAMQVCDCYYQDHKIDGFIDALCNYLNEHTS